MTITIRRVYGCSRDAPARILPAFRNPPLPAPSLARCGVCPVHPTNPPNDLAAAHRQETRTRRSLRQLDDGLARAETVQGLLDITQGPVTLNQEFWLQRPSFLRTETESGPGAFQGVIVALQPPRGWVYSPALNLVTVVDRSNYTPVLAGEAGAGSSLERLPADVRRAVEAGYPIHKAGNETLAGRRTDHWEISVPAGDAASRRGHCMFGLTQNTPTRWPCVMPPAARFASDPSTSTQPSTHSSSSSSPARRVGTAR